MTHQLKVLPDYFAALRSGAKRFEVRRFDRDFNVGDRLVLSEYDPALVPDKTSSSVDPRVLGYTGGSLEADITYILPGGAFGIADDYCVLSLTKPQIIVAQYQQQEAKP